MDNLCKLIENIITKDTLIEAILSNLRISTDYNKVIIKPVIINNIIYYQFSFFYNKKVIHKNLDKQDSINELKSLFDTTFKQGNIFTKDNDIQILISKKFKVTILNSKPTKNQASLEHNRNKDYLLTDNKPIDFLIELGVMNQNGKVISKKYDKFKQINRFLEMIDDIIPNLKTNKRLNIIDFGCGKSYLTFAVYYYLKIIKNFDINIIGLDLKQDVIDNCNQLANKLNYENLKFYTGDIENYITDINIDMVITLHACDTATDAALEKAIKWNCDVILSVPCCHHELNSQIKNDKLNPMLKYGILKERFAALATDAIRANLLEISGYKVQLLEFIDMEHTPKNILIRATKSKKMDNSKKLNDYLIFKNFLNANPYLENKLCNMDFFEKYL